GRRLLRRATGQDGPARPRRVAESPNLPFPASGGGYGGRAAHPSYNDQHNMAVKIRVPGALRQLTRGAAIVEVDAGDVSQALDELNQKFPGFKERLYDDKGELRQFINIYRNDEDIRFGSGLKTPLKDSDDLSIVPAVAGG